MCKAGRHTPKDLQVQMQQKVFLESIESAVLNIGAHHTFKIVIDLEKICIFSLSHHYFVLISYITKYIQLRLQLC